MNTASMPPALARKAVLPKLTAYLVMAVILPAVCLFGSAGTLNWLWGWLLLGFLMLFSIGSRLVMLFVNPDILVERGNSLDAANVKAWDRVLVPLIAILLPFLTLIVSGIDYRFSLTQNVSDTNRIIALIVMNLGMAFSTWAFFANRFFSGTVRIQTERGHTVVTSGPYQIIRHPGYLGAVVTYVATPLVLGSLWGLIPAVLLSLGFVIRTALEDATLQTELPGYREFAQQTRYRLIPFVW